MFLRTNKRWKNGKWHRYYSIVENRRLTDGKVVQRTVLYLGEINDCQEAAWRKTLEVSDESSQQKYQLSLFPEDRPIPPDALDAIAVRLSQIQLRRPRSFGDCWLGCWLWQKLGLDQFWQDRLQSSRSDLPWSKVLQLLVINRLIDPGSEFRVHRQWFDRSAMDELLAVDFKTATKDRLYRCLDRILKHKRQLFSHLQEQWKGLFSASFDVLLYDLTSTYFEGLCEQNPKAKHGYSRDRRSDCRQVIIALIITPDGLPLAYEVMPGNTSDKTTLRSFLSLIESLYGKARRIWVMDRGIPTEELLAEMRSEGVQYLVGTTRSRLDTLEAELLDLPWQQVHENVRVKLLVKDGELYILTESAERREKEKSIRRHKLRLLFRGLVRLQSNCRDRDRLLQNLGALKHQAGRAARFVEISLPPSGSKVTPKSFTFKLKVDAIRTAQRRDGSYLLRSNSIEEDPGILWERYIQLTQIEAAFRCLKSDLAVRPVYHQLEHRVEAHIFIAFQAYCLMVTLRKYLNVHAGGLTARAVFEKLATIQMVDVWLPTTDGRWLIMPRYTQPEIEHEMILCKLGLRLPKQPPPRISSRQLPIESAKV
ncbi:MAG: IS1634 family transposase [Phycisphaerae bacterium]